MEHKQDAIAHLETENGSELADDNHHGVAYPRPVRVTVTVDITLNVPDDVSDEDIVAGAFTHLCKYGYDEFREFAIEEDVTLGNHTLITADDRESGHRLADEAHAPIAYTRAVRATLTVAVDLHVPTNASDDELKFAALTHLLKYGYHDAIDCEVYDRPTAPDDTGFA